MKSIGYEGIGNVPIDFSLLERVFGQAYLNLTSLELVYFGKSPYKLETRPRPHLKFDRSRLNLKLLLRAPWGWLRMLRVAWTVQTSRHELSKRALSYVQVPAFAELNSKEIYQQHKELNLPDLQKVFHDLCRSFSEEHLQGTFLLTLLIESSIQGLAALLEKDLGQSEAAESLQRLMGEGLHTETTDMFEQLTQGSESEEQWQVFLNNYGHRGVGELELSHPRWIETERPQLKNIKSLKPLVQKRGQVYEETLPKLSALRRPLFIQEWKELQKLLQIREKIKMQTMKPYAQIRWLALAISKKANMGLDIFWLRIEEVLSLKEDQKNEVLKKNALRRKSLAQQMKSLDLPMIVSLEDLQEVLEGRRFTGRDVNLNGVSLSPGLAGGVVHIVDDPDKEDLDSWPDNYILVAEATDPGWTPLFQRARAVIVARGGVLSHCAIVAREMGLPAVGEILGASHIFKEGERVWVDGVHGTVRRNN